MPDIDKERDMSRKQIVHQIITVAISSAFTLVGLYESLVTEQACFVFWICALMLVLTALVLRTRYPQKFWTLLLNAGVIALLSLVVFLNDRRSKVEGTVWYESLREKADERLIDMKSKADGGDGHAQAWLSDYYDDNRDYVNAIKYAQKAANNGNALSYMRIAWYNLYGLGCKVDVQESITNLINAMRLERIDYSHIIREIRAKGIALSPTDSIKLNKRIENTELFDRIYQNVDSLGRKKGLMSAVNYLESNKGIIENASVDGYRPATALLYACEYMKKPLGSEELQRLANVLYQSSYIPTQIYFRPYFFRSYYNDRTYSLKNYRKYIEDNDYVFLSFGEVILNSPTFAQETFDSDYTNDALLNAYELFRAQYDWSKQIEDGTGPSVLFFYMAPPDQERDYVGIARELLRRSIVAVQKRMDTPAGRDTSKYDLLTNVQVEIGIDTPLSVSDRQHD